MRVLKLDESRSRRHLSSMAVSRASQGGYPSRVPSAGTRSSDGPPGGRSGARLTDVSDPEPTQYDAVAAEYEEHAAGAPYNALYDRPATLELIGDIAGKRALEAGCGPGFYVAELLARGAEVVACDASARMIELARARVAGGAELRVHSLEEPFDWLEGSSLDVVVSALVYHHVNNRSGFLNEMRRVLRPDGALVISTHHPTTDWRRLGGSYFAVEPVTERWSRGWQITAWRMPLTQLTGEFSEAGFLIERLVEPRPHAQMAVTHPESFRRLSTEPGFLFCRLVPRAS